MPFGTLNQMCSCKLCTKNTGSSRLMKKTNTFCHYASNTDIFLRHLSVGKQHKILSFVTLIKPTNKEGHSSAMQMSSEMLHHFSIHCNIVHLCRKFPSEEFHIYIYKCLSKGNVCVVFSLMSLLYKDIICV